MNKVFTDSMSLRIVLILLISASAQFCIAQPLSVYQSFTGDRYYEGVSEISRDNFKSLMAQNPTANDLWKKSRVNGGIAFGTVVTGSVLLGVGLANDDSGSDTAFIISGTVLIVGSLFFSGRSLKFRREALLDYNADHVSLGPELYKTPFRQLTVGYPIGG